MSSNPVGARLQRDDPGSVTDRRSQRQERARLMLVARTAAAVAWLGQGGTMCLSKGMVRALLVGLAFGFIQGCTAVPEKAAEEDSLTNTVVQSFYKKRVYMTGSRIPRVVDTRKSLDLQSSHPLKVIEAN